MARHGTAQHGTHGPGEADSTRWQHHGLLKVHGHLCQLPLHPLGVRPLLRGAGVCQKYETVEGLCTPPSASSGRDAPKGGGSISSPTGVTK